MILEFIILGFIIYYRIIWTTYFLIAAENQQW